MLIHTHTHLTPGVRQSLTGFVAVAQGMRRTRDVPNAECVAVRLNM